MQEKRKQVCVYCGSSDKANGKYIEAAYALGVEFVKNNYDLVYGGGARGSMNAIANAVMDNGGTVTGYIPQFMMQVEWGKNNISKLIEVSDMSERKKKLIENVDAVVAMPGGCGTLEELAEVISLKRLGQFLKPIVIFNQDGFYDDLISLFNKMIEHDFMRPEHGNIWAIASKIEDVIPAIENSKLWTADAIHSAAV